MQVAIVGRTMPSAHPFTRIEPGQHTSIEVSIPGENIPEGVPLPVEVTIRQRSPRRGTEDQRVEPLRVPRSRQLVERTVEQAEFENMF